MAIEIKNVTKRFGKTVALHDVSLRLEAGRIYGLLGNNGAGKTTLLRVITNRLYPDGGEVLLDGMETADQDRVLGKVFMMGEENLYPDGMRVKKAFAVTGRFYPDFDLAYAEKLAARFGLDTRKKITSLSTGYASIFRLIVALSVNAPYLLLDEPVLGLDAQHRDMFYRALLEKVAERSCTVVISTHLIAEVANLIEHVCIIRNGRIIQDVPCDALLSDLYTVSGPAAAVDAYTADAKVLSANTLGGLKTVCVQGVPDQARELPAGLELGGMNLQDYFISLMNKEDAR